MLRLLLLGFLASLIPVASECAPLYFFGDSLTDTGNVYKATSVLNRYTFGIIPVAPSAPYVGGRFTNGPVWAEQVAARFGRPQDAQPAGMSLGIFGQVGGSGNNYAIGGARTGFGGALGLLDIFFPTGIFEQVDFYFARTHGTADPAGLYFLFGGGNDLRDAARITDPAQRLRAAQQAGANLAYSLRDLYLAGARQFVLIDSPDVGLIPESIGDGVSDAATDASVQFNTWLAAYADYLHTIPGLSINYFDLFALHRELVNQYGTAAIRPCKNTPSECQQTLFFDSIHPNAWVHEIIGNRIADQLLLGNTSTYQTYAVAALATPEPSSGILLVSAAAVLFVFRVRHKRAG